MNKRSILMAATAMFSTFASLFAQAPGSTVRAEAGQTHSASTTTAQQWPSRPQARAGAPNVVLILIDHWPTGRGFDYFYGFVKAAANQYYLRIHRNTSPVEPATTPEQGYDFTTDITNDAIHWIHAHDAVSPDKPFFLYFATGATHEPHQLPHEWIEKYKGKFDEG
jgi:arylsulfatase A-like enzyme